MSVVEKIPNFTYSQAQHGSHAGVPQNVWGAGFWSHKYSLCDTTRSGRGRKGTVISGYRFIIMSHNGIGKGGGVVGESFFILVGPGGADAKTPTKFPENWGKTDKEILWMISGM